MTDVEKRIEADLLALPWVQGAKEVPFLESFFDRFASKLNLGKTSFSLLEAFESIDVTADRVALIISANAYYEHQFLKMIESLSKREDQPSVEAAIVLLGMQNSRNLIIALQILRSVRGTHPQWDDNGKLTIQPKEYVKFGLKAEEPLVAAKDEYSGVGFGAGVIFDVLAEAANFMDADKKVGPYIEVVFGHGLRAAKIGNVLADDLPNFAWKKYAFAACLVHDIGKAIMAICDPTYVDFMDEVSKGEFTREVRQYLEKKRFGINHEVLSALAAYYFLPTREMQLAIRYHHAPMLIKDGKKEVHELACLVSIASNMASKFKNIQNPEDPIVRSWKGPELEGFPYSLEKLTQVIGKVPK